MAKTVAAAPERTAATPDAGIVSSLRPIVVLVTGVGIRSFGTSFYNVFLLLFFHSALNLSYVVAGLYIAILGLVTLPLGQIGGGISDRVGRRRMIVYTLAGEAVGLAILAWGFSISSLGVVLGALLVSRAFGVIGSPAGFAYVADSMDATLRAKGLSWLRVTQNLGFFGGVALGGVLLTFVAYGQVTALAALIVGSSAIVSAAWLTPSPHDLSISQHPVAPGTTTAQRPSVFRWLGQSTYTSFRPMWRDRTLLLVMVATILMGLMLTQFAYAIPAFSQAHLGIPYGILGLALSLSGLIPALTQIPITKALSGRLHTRIGIWGSVTYAVSFVAFGFDAIYGFAVVVALFALMIVTTIGEDMVFLPAYTLPLNIAPKDSRGVYSGALQTTINLIGIFSPLFAGVALTFASQPLITWGILAAPALPAILILSYLGSRIPPEHNRI